MSNQDQQNLWENDPSLIPKTPEYVGRVQRFRFQILQTTGAKLDGPEFKNSTPEFIKSYTAWLALPKDKQ